MKSTARKGKGCGGTAGVATPTAAHACAHTCAHTHNPFCQRHRKPSSRPEPETIAGQMGGGVTCNTARILLPVNFLGKGQLTQENSEVRQKPGVSEKRNCQQPRGNEKCLAASVTREIQSKRKMLYCFTPSQLASSGSLVICPPSGEVEKQPG